MWLCKSTLLSTYSDAERVRTRIDFLEAVVKRQEHKAKKDGIYLPGAFLFWNRNDSK